MTVEHINVLGSTIAVDSIDSEDDRTRLRAQWSRCMSSAASEAVTSVDYGTHDDADRRDYALASALTLTGINLAAGDRLMLHAAGVADPGTGRVAALIAPSGTGKTTAARLLCTSGFGYVTDETVSIGEHEDVLPYPKPLSVVINGDAPDHKSQHGPDELGLAPCPPDPHVALFVLLDRDEARQEEPELSRVPLLDGVLELIPQTSALPSMRRPLQSLIRTVARAGGVWRLRYREIADAAPLLRTRLAALAPDPSEIVEVAASEDTGSGEPPEQPAPSEPPVLSTTTRVIRGPHLDAIRVDDEIVVLVGAKPARLTGLGATIWAHSAQPASIAALADACLRDHGEHPDADRLVHEGIGELLRHQVLVLAD